LLATLILLAIPEEALSAETADRAGGFAAVVAGGGAELGAGAVAVVAGAVVVTGLSAFNLAIRLIIGVRYGFIPPSFSRATISQISTSLYHRLHMQSFATTLAVLSRLSLAKSLKTVYSARPSSLKVLRVFPI